MKASIFCALAFALSMTAFAGGDKGTSNKQDHNVSWEEFKARCANPDSFPDIQRAPQNIQIQCTDVSSEYLPLPPKSVSLPETRTVTTTVISDKFQVAQTSMPVAVAAATGTCMQFQQVIKSATVSFNPSCDEVAGFKGSQDDYCQTNLDQAFGKGGAKINVTQTSNIIGTCPSDNTSDNGKGGKDNGKGGTAQ